MVERITIDRFEEDYAVCEDALGLTMRTLHRSELPKEAKAGDTLFYMDNQWYIDKEETAARAARIKSMFERIKRRNSI
jgi:hypothetical protein